MLRFNGKPAAALSRLGHPPCRAAHAGARRRLDHQHGQRRRVVTVAKAGVLHLSKLPTGDLAKHSIRVNASAGAV